MRLIQRAIGHYAKDTLTINLGPTVYALVATTIDLRPSLFDWAPFHTAKTAIKIHTLLDRVDPFPPSFTPATARCIGAGCSSSPAARGAWIRRSCVRCQPIGLPG